MIKAYLNESISEPEYWQVEIYETRNGEPTDDSEFETFKTREAAEARAREINKAKVQSWYELPEGSY